ncbi:MAG: N-6 DNA methylase [Mucispirillum sp.]|nr:N-6 DNA methylase [Mucispirillum sp.]
MNKLEILNGSAKDTYDTLYKIIYKHANVSNKTSMIIPTVFFTVYVAKEQIKPETITLDDLISGRLFNDKLLSQVILEYITPELWNDIKPLISKISASDIHEIISHIISNGINNDSITLPFAINKLIAQLFKIKDNDLICNAYCGAGSFINDNIDILKHKNITLVDIDLKNIIINKILSYITKNNSNILFKDFFEFINMNTTKYNKFFLNHPWGAINRYKYEDIKHFFQNECSYIKDMSKNPSAEWAYVLAAIKCLEQNGKIITLMTNSSLFNTADEPIRKYLIENGKIECIISMPSNLLSHTSISFNVVVISHGNKNIKMVDAHKFYKAGRRQNEISEENILSILDAVENNTNESLFTDINTLCKNNYILSPVRYFENIPEFKNPVYFGDIIDNISRGALLKAKQIDEISSIKETNYQYISLANINNNVISDNLPYLTNIESNLEKYCIKNNDILLSKNGIPYKVAILSNLDKNKKILVNGNFYIIRVNEEKANPYYIKALLESELGYKLLKKISAGAVIPNISIENLKKLIIPLPDLKTQNQIVNGYIAILDEIAILKNKIKKAEYKMVNYFNNFMEV